MKNWRENSGTERTLNFSLDCKQKSKDKSPRVKKLNNRNSFSKTVKSKMFGGHFEEIAASKQQICNQVQQLNESINKCRDKVHEQYEDLYNLKRTRKEHHLSEWERFFLNEENLIEAIEQNIKRMKKYCELAAKTLADLDRIELHIESRNYAKVDVFLYCLVALLSGIFMVGSSLFLYLLNLVAVLKINFAILEIIGLQNWQRHKLLGSLSINILEFFGCLYLIVNAIMEGRYFEAIRWIMPIRKIIFDFKHRVKQYSDMKKPRPVIPNFNTPFPA